mgnify:CR=1 FL=1
MLPGPVFSFERLRVSRNRTLFLHRTTLGVMVLFVLGVTGYNVIYDRPFESSQISHTEASGLAIGFFSAVFFPLGIGVLSMTPGTFASLIPEDRQRKILFAMMTTPLSGIEIILGKFLIRYFILISYLGISVPIIALLNLYGGVPPVILALCYGTTMTAVWFYGSLAMLVSVWSRVPRAANSSAFLLMFSLVGLPFLIRNLPPSGTLLEPWLTLYSGVYWSNQCLEPFSLLCVAFDTASNLRSNVIDSTGFLTAIGLQFSGGVVALLLAGLSLRRADRRIEGGEPKLSWFKRVSDRRITTAPPVLEGGATAFSLLGERSRTGHHIVRGADGLALSQRLLRLLEDRRDSGLGPDGRLVRG